MGTKCGSASTITDFKKYLWFSQDEGLVSYSHWDWYPRETVKATKHVSQWNLQRVRVGKHLSDMFPYKNGMKQGADLCPLLLNLLSGTPRCLELNDTHQLLVYADDVSILVWKLRTINKNIKFVLVASEEMELEVNDDKTMYKVEFRVQSAGINENQKFDNI